MKEENIKKIKAFFLKELNIEETQIKRHRNHDLIIKNLLPTKEKSGLMMMIIYFKCLNCKKIWKHPIRGSKNYLMSLSNKVIDLQYDLQQSEMTRFKSESHKIIKSKDKEYKDRDLEISNVGNNKKLKDNSKGNYERGENREDFFNFDIGEYVRFELKERKKRTSVISVIRIGTDEVVGTIKWGAKKYCFNPTDENIWETDYDDEVDEFVEKLTNARKGKWWTVPPGFFWK